MRDMLLGKWITNGLKEHQAAPVFCKNFIANGVKSAALYITSLGVYEAMLN